MFYLLHGFAILVLAVAGIVLGAGLAVNCARGLFSGEGMYDESNKSYMTWMQVAGIFASLGAAAWGINTLFGRCLW